MDPTITAIESACQKLNQQDAEELREDINRVLRRFHPKPNLNKAEQVIRELKRDKSRIILTADKGVTIVVMVRQDYIDKANNLLAQPAYRPIPQEPHQQNKGQSNHHTKEGKIGYTNTCTQQDVVPLIL